MMVDLNQLDFKLVEECFVVSVANVLLLEASFVFLVVLWLEQTVFAADIVTTIIEEIVLADAD
jgi:hypothetical protein